MVLLFGEVMLFLDTRSDSEDFSIRAGGEAVGVTMLGVFDRTTKKIDVVEIWCP